MIPFSWTSWEWHPSITIGFLVWVIGYFYGIGPLRERYQLGAKPNRRQVAAFVLGSLTVLVSLEGPIHELADNYLLSAHMIQHLMLQLAMPPLILIGTPGWLLRPAIKNHYVLSIARRLTHPVVAFFLFNFNLVVWHLPPLYDLALQTHGVHIFQHLTFMVTAVIAWWPLLSPSKEIPRSAYPLQIVYIFAQSVPMGFLGAIITFAGEPLYEYYSVAPRLWGVSALADQQLGGIIMKSLAGIAFLSALGFVFLSWAKSEGSGKIESEIP